MNCPTCKSEKVRHVSFTTLPVAQNKPGVPQQWVINMACTNCGSGFASDPTTEDPHKVLEAAAARNADEIAAREAAANGASPVVVERPARAARVSAADSAV